MMLEVPFTISSKPAAINKNQRVSFSIPFAKSAIFSVEQLSVLSPDNEIIQADYRVLHVWSNGALKWVRCEFITNTNCQKTNGYRVIKSDTNHNTGNIEAISVTQQNQKISIACAQHTYIINEAKLGFECLPWQVELHDNNNNKIPQKITKLVNPATTSAHSHQIDISGSFQTENEFFKIEFDTKLTFSHSQSSVEVEFTLRNASPMSHHGGKWDLGNENSFFFSACNIAFDSQQAELKLTKNDSWQIFDHNQTLFQASSGGENWQSSNHININRENPLTFQGYKLSNESTLVAQGSRAQPINKITQNQGELYVSLVNFWQNFPKSIKTQNAQVIMGLFPEESNEAHELQPGEQKTHKFYIALNEEDIAALIEPAIVNICPKYLASTHAIPFLSSDEQTDGIDDIIKLGLNSDNNFFEKREQIDEFGWRNFGDLYADHETLEYKGEQELISHYNNQYDPLYGFIRQFLLTSDTKWWELAENLAQHIKDIDIYHTDDDKAEYNHGLFWHTDHYLPAETASHRTYSKHQDANAYQDHAGGGGPGGQHCYTTGLMLHYFLTGDETSKTTAVNLAHWITYVYEGTGTFLDNLLKIKNRHWPGGKNVLTEQYPLDRGTGNYIIALIDAYDLSGKQSYLDQASLVIKHTASPNEALNNRNLNNIEEAWFYTVFLQAVGRYLHTKEQIKQVDESFEYARALLLHFSNWMVTNEQPYLNTPDVLEYPNHTWAAQDIRKANVLYLASYFCFDKEKKSAYKIKADDIYQYVIDALSSEKTNYFTRILSILMQNHGVKSYVNQNQFKEKLTDDYSSNTIKNNSSTAKKMFKVLSKSLLSTSVTKELTWLRIRVKKVDNLLLKVGLKK